MNPVLLNMLVNILSFLFSLIISFFLTPYITQFVGIEAYGLIGLANSFVGYITILTSALNSMASRFIVIEIHRNDMCKANTYFSSVLYANLLIALLLLIPFITLIFNIDILNVSPNLIYDAQLTFLIIAFSFFLNLVFARYGLVLYAKNILWKGGFRVMESNLIRVLLIVIFFYIFSPHIYWVVLATFLSSIYTLIFNILYSTKLLPELKVKRSLFSLKAVKELVCSGIWNSITKLGQILLDGLDLLLSNLFINGLMTGYVSIAKTVPTLYTSMLAIVSDSFYPTFLELYSKRDYKKLLDQIKNSISVLSSITAVSMSLLLVYAKDFYTLWIPNSEPILLRDITYCAVGTVLISGCIYSLYSVFTLTNKLRTNSIVILITGLLSFVSTFICLKYTSLGVYAIVGVSSLWGILRNLFFTPIYAAHCLRVNKYSFYPVILKNLLNILLLIFLFFSYKYFFPIHSWSDLLMNGLINILLGFLITYFVVLNKNEQILLLKVLKIKK